MSDDPAASEAEEKEEGVPPNPPANGWQTAPTNPPTTGTPENTPSPEAPPPLTPQQRRERAITDAMRTAVRDFFHQHYQVSPEKLAPMDLQLNLSLTPADNWQLAFDPPLEDQIIRQLADQEADFASYVEGHVYCFHCDSANCAHSLPPTPLSVFDAYTSLGEPKWVEFSQKLLDAHHEEVDQLYRSAPGRKPVILNHLQFGKELRAEQLSSFGRASKTYSILGQITAGYFVPPKRWKAKHGPLVADGRFALTFQLVETRGRGGALKLRLNTIVHKGAVPDLNELLDSDWHPWLHRARHLTMEQIANIESMAQSVRGQDPKRFQQIMGKTAGVMRKFSRSLSRGDRQAKRRTQHAEKRRQEHTRPTDKAFEDATASPNGDLYWEERNDTIAVVAHGGRTHIFSAIGKHVTSFQLKKDGLEKRLRSKRWRPATTEEITAFRTGLKGEKGPA